MNTIKIFISYNENIQIFTRENSDVFITLDDNIYGINSKRVNILYVLMFPYFYIKAYYVGSCQYCLLRYPEYRVWSFMQIVSLGNNLHEKSNPIFWEK